MSPRLRQRSPPPVAPAPERPRVTRRRRSVLRSNEGEPIPIVHLAAECWPYARSGGLGEAVASLANYQAAAGLPTLVVMPHNGHGMPVIARIGQTNGRWTGVRARSSPARGAGSGMARGTGVHIFRPIFAITET